MATGTDLLNAARSFSGLSYRLDPPPDGATTIDCSLLILKAAEQAGIPLGGVRTAEQIRQATLPVDWDDVLPGDLLFFEHTYDAAGPAGPDGRIASHVGISLGAGTRRMLDAHERGGPDVAETDIGPAYWQDKLIEARRLPRLANETPNNSQNILSGVDVASYQGNPDWEQVAASGQAFAITKATGGTWYVNPTFGRNWAGIRASGLVRGAYHYAFETSGQPFPGAGPEAEADYFLATVRAAGGVETGDLLVLDIEDGNGALGEWALAWCRRVEQQSGVVPLIYTGAWFSVPHGFGSVPELSRFPLWLAAYTASLPPAPAPWRSVAMWQRTDKGSVPGIAGNVDMNTFYGDREALLALGKPGAAPQPAPESPYSVGDGIRARMAALNDTPASSEVYGEFWSEAVGRSGRIYRWLRLTNQIHVYEPAA